MTLAVIYVRTGERRRRDESTCLAHATTHHADVVALVVDDRGNRWPDVERMLATGEADTVIVARLADVPGPVVIVPAGACPDGVPRVAVAHPAGTSGPPGQRRPRPIRWE